MSALRRDGLIKPNAQHANVTASAALSSLLLPAYNHFQQCMPGTVNMRCVIEEVQMVTVAVPMITSRRSQPL